MSLLSLNIIWVSEPLEFNHGSKQRNRKEKEQTGIGKLWPTVKTFQMVVLRHKQTKQKLILRERELMNFRHNSQIDNMKAETTANLKKKKIKLCSQWQKCKRRPVELIITTGTRCRELMNLRHSSQIDNMKAETTANLKKKKVMLSMRQLSWIQWQKCKRRPAELVITTRCRLTAAEMQRDHQQSVHRELNLNN